MANREFTIADEYQYNRAGPIRWIISHGARYPLFLSGFILATLVSNGLFAATPCLTGLAFDEVLQASPDRGRLLTITLLVLGIVLAQGIIYLAASLSVEVLGQRLERDARDELYLSLLGKSQTFHNRQRVGDLMARAANDVRQLNLMTNPGIFLILDSFSGLFIPIIFMGFIRLDLLLTPLLFTLVFLGALRRYTRQLNPVAARMREQFGEMNTGLAETVAGIEVVK